MIYLLGAAVALAFLALLVCVVLLVRGLQADLTLTRAALAKHTTRTARVLAVQLARDREEHPSMPRASPPLPAREPIDAPGVACTAGAGASRRPDRHLHCRRGGLPMPGRRLHCRRGGLSMPSTWRERSTGRTSTLRHSILPVARGRLVPLVTRPNRVERRHHKPSGLSSPKTRRPASTTSPSSLPIPRLTSWRSSTPIRTSSVSIWCEAWTPSART